MASLNLNKVVLAGRITADPELKTTQSGISVTTFSLAINRRYSKDREQQQADFITIVAWRNTAEFITKYFRKNSTKRKNYFYIPFFKKSKKYSLLIFKRK